MFLRKRARRTKQGHFRNEDIQGMIKQKPVIDKIEKYQLKQFGCVTRKNEKNLNSKETDGGMEEKKWKIQD